MSAGTAGMWDVARDEALETVGGAAGVIGTPRLIAWGAVPFTSLCAGLTVQRFGLAGPCGRGQCLGARSVRRVPRTSDLAVEPAQAEAVPNPVEPSRFRGSQE